MAARLAAMRRMAEAGYRIGLTIAPIIAVQGWREAYAVLIADVAAALAEGRDLDLTVELITHRYTPGSKAVLESWYPGSALDMGGAGRAEKRTKFSSIKHVYDAPTMKELRRFFEDEIARVLPAARILYWTRDRERWSAMSAFDPSWSANFRRMAAVRPDHDVEAWCGCA